MMIIMWLAVVVLLGITAIDAGSIAFTKFRLADVASTASTAAANAFRSTPNTVTACQAAEEALGFRRGHDAPGAPEGRPHLSGTIRILLTHPQPRVAAYCIEWRGHGRDAHR